jgi:hypothetical protein
MRSTKMDALALEEALGLDDFDLLRISPEIHPQLRDVSDDDDTDTIGLRRLLEFPEALSSSLPQRLRSVGLRPARLIRGSP